MAASSVVFTSSRPEFVSFEARTTATSSSSVRSINAKMASSGTLVPEGNGFVERTGRHRAVEKKTVAVTSDESLIDSSCSSK